MWGHLRQELVTDAVLVMIDGVLPNRSDPYVTVNFFDACKEATTKTCPDTLNPKWYVLIRCRGCAVYQLGNPMWYQRAMIVCCCSRVYDCVCREESEMIHYRGPLYGCLDNFHATLDVCELLFVASTNLVVHLACTLQPKVTSFVFLNLLNMHLVITSKANQHGTAISFLPVVHSTSQLNTLLLDPAVGWFLLR